MEEYKNKKKARWGEKKMKRPERIKQRKVVDKVEEKTQLKDEGIGKKNPVFSA